MALALLDDGTVKADWDLVCAHLAATTAGSSPLNQATLERAFCACDGFGAMGTDALTINSGWDWSHVRDSSPTAIAAAAGILREGLAELGRNDAVAASY